MESFKIGVFDIFAYTLPGMIFLIGLIVLLDTSLKSVEKVQSLFKDVTLVQTVFYSTIAYVLGFSLDTPASQLFYKVIFKLFQNPRDKTYKKYDLDRERKHELLALVREKCPNNNDMLQTWKVLKNMSHNLALSFIICAVFFAVKIIFFCVNSNIEWSLLCFSCITLSVVLMHRAWIFETWFYDDLIHTSKAFDFL